MSLLESKISLLAVWDIISDDGCNGISPCEFIIKKITKNHIFASFPASPDTYFKIPKQFLRLDSNCNIVFNYWNPEITAHEGHIRY